MAIKSFKDFITEELDHVRHKKVKHVEDHDPEEECPRCGEHADECQCEEDDPWSTQNYHRVPKGTEHKAKPKQEFKK